MFSARPFESVFAKRYRHPRSNKRNSLRCGNAKLFFNKQVSRRELRPRGNVTETSTIRFPLIFRIILTTYLTLKRANLWSLMPRWGIFLFPNSYRYSSQCASVRCRANRKPDNWIRKDQITGREKELCVNDLELILFSLTLTKEFYGELFDHTGTGYI